MKLAIDVQMLKMLKNDWSYNSTPQTLLWHAWEQPCFLVFIPALYYRFTQNSITTFHKMDT
jgi:hypothetical protein